MSIRLMIREWVKDGALTLLPPTISSDSAVRWIFCSKEVWTALNGPWRSTDEQSNMGRARGALDAFVTGKIIAVRLPPSKNIRAHLAMLSEAEEEVWEFRCRDPSPQVRIFGRFADKDTFIALLSKYKTELANDDDYLAAKEDCKREWRVYFPSYPPHTGTQADDYVSNCAVLG